MLSCTQCNKKFRYKSEKVRHEQSHSRQFECSFCNKKFNFQSALNRHEKQHGRTGNVSCDKCGHRFRDEVLLKRHMKYAHDGTHKCEHCDSTFHSLTALQNHVRIHQPESERKFFCKFDGCKKSFNFSHHLKNHELTHTNTKKYFCKFCGKGFIQGHHLKIHLKTHSAKWFYCEEDGCSKKFLSSVARDKHYTTHRMFSASPSFSECFPLSDISDDQNKLLTIEVECDAIPINSKLVIENQKSQIKQAKYLPGEELCVNNNTCKSVLGMYGCTKIVKSCLCAETNTNSPQDLVTITHSKNTECHNLLSNTQICGECECYKNNLHINPNRTILMSSMVPEITTVSRKNGIIKIEDTFDSSIQIKERENNITEANIPFNSCKAVLGTCIVSGNGTMGEECLCAKMMNDQNINSEEIDELTLVPYT